MTRYDSHAGIQEYLVDLAHLHLLLRDRREAAGRGEQLLEWLWDGRWRFDRFGQTFYVTGGSPREVAPEKFVHKLVPWEEASHHSEMLMCEGRYPAEPMAACQRCENRWTFDDMHDQIDVRGGDGEQLYYHTLGLSYVRLEYAQDHYNQAFKEAGYLGVKLLAIPNQYWPNQLGDAEEPWFFVMTDKGRFRIGRRKRVWHVDWAQTTLPELPPALKVEDVTKGEKFIHAWSYVKLVHYLKTLREAAKTS